MITTTSTTITTIITINPTITILIVNFRVLGFRV